MDTEGDKKNSGHGCPGKWERKLNVSAFWFNSDKISKIKDSTETDTMTEWKENKHSCSLLVPYFVISTDLQPLKKAPSKPLAPSPYHLYAFLTSHAVLAVFLHYSQLLSSGTFFSDLSDPPLFLFTHLDNYWWNI